MFLDFRSISLSEKKMNKGIVIAGTKNPKRNLKSGAVKKPSNSPANAIIQINILESFCEKSKTKGAIKAER